LVGSFDVAFAPASELATALSRREVSVRELVEESLAAIAALDPKIHAFTCVLAESALQEADEAQARLDAGEQRPFLGIPVAVKDEVDLAGTVTSYGTRAQVTPARADSHLVARLRQAERC
jgi:amidase